MFCECAFLPASVIADIEAVFGFVSLFDAKLLPYEIRKDRLKRFLLGRYKFRRRRRHKEESDDSRRRTKQRELRDSSQTVQLEERRRPAMKVGLFLADANKRKEETMFIVITGGPSVGKSTLIKMLKSLRYEVIEEQATKIIEEGKILPWEDRDAFQREVLDRQLKAEEKVSGTPGPIFLDRGAYDGEAYYLMDGLVPPDSYDRVRPDRYSRVFLLEELPVFDDNGIRFENLEFTRRITPILEECYTKRLIQVERLAAMPAEKRLSSMLASVSEMRLALKAG